jgi:hypothetical protein
MWYRIFAGNSDMPAPDALREFLSSRYASISVEFAADDSGWYQADLLVDGVAFQLERYLADEPGLRAELNSWAAWLETRENAPEHVRLMERMIQTVQLFTLQSKEESARCEEACVALCRYFAEMTDGVYQIDERGFFAAEGRLLVAE